MELFRDLYHKIWKNGKCCVVKEDNTHSNSPTGFFKGYDLDMSSSNNENYKGKYSDGDSFEEIATKTSQV